MNDVFATAPTDDRPRTVALTEAAARRVAALIEADGKPGLMLRLTVSGGGCSGFQYGFSFDSEVTADDRVYERHGVPVVIDEISLDLLNGAVVDWKEDLSGAMFVIENPNAASSCGCGSSFAI